jgi:hypothetical protein
MSADLFPCFGISALGMCAYNPTQPSPTYFNLGNAVAALAFTLAVQQLLKPIYGFRLQAYGLRLGYMVAAIFVGASGSIIAMVVPNLGIFHSGPFAYPIFWELLSGFIITATYGLVAFISLTPARVYGSNIISFVRAGSTLLSGATEEDRASFAEDILNQKNIDVLIRHACAFERAEHHAINVEFERLRSIGAKLEISGSPSPSAFYIFAYRRELEKATIAATFLRIISDHELCSVAVRRHPWRVANMLQHLSMKQLYSPAAREFIQQLAAQAIIQEGSLLAKEIRPGGFSGVSFLSENLFGNYFIIRNYNPLQGLAFEAPDTPTKGVCERLNSATKMMLDTAIRHQDFWPQGYMFPVRVIYQHLSRVVALYRRAGKQLDATLPINLGVQDLSRAMRDALNSLDWNRHKGLFVTDPKGRQYSGNIVGIVASIVFDNFEEIANAFKGIDDQEWTHAISLFMDIYPSIGTAPEGMDALQQQLALRLLAKVRENMNGWYPAVTRVLLAVVEPYKRKSQADRSAYALFRDAFYRELQKLTELHVKKPDKVIDFLPDNVAYDAGKNILTHSFRSGKVAITNLSELSIPEIDLCKEDAWRQPGVQGG